MSVLVVREEARPADVRCRGRNRGGGERAWRAEGAGAGKGPRPARTQAPHPTRPGGPGRQRGSGAKGVPTGPRKDRRDRAIANKPRLPAPGPKGAIRGGQPRPLNCEYAVKYACGCGVHLCLVRMRGVLSSFGTAKERVLLSFGTPKKRVLLSFGTQENRVLLSFGTQEKRVLLSFGTHVLFYVRLSFLSTFPHLNLGKSRYFVVRSLWVVLTFYYVPFICTFVHSLSC